MLNSAADCVALQWSVRSTFQTRKTISGKYYSQILPTMWLNWKTFWFFLYARKFHFHFWSFTFTFSLNLFLSNYIYMLLLDLHLCICPPLQTIYFSLLPSKTKALCISLSLNFMLNFRQHIPHKVSILLLRANTPKPCRRGRCNCRLCVQARQTKPLHGYHWLPPLWPRTRPRTTGSIYGPEERVLLRHIGKHSGKAGAKEKASVCVHAWSRQMATTGYNYSGKPLNI